jgi:hypothetical protein
MQELFIDAGAWFAILEPSDNHHHEAVELFPRLLKKYQVFVTTNLVIAEAYILIRKRMGHAVAMQYLNETHNSARLVRIPSNEELELQAEVILRQYDDQTFSYADAVSFAVMKQRGITDVFTYDDHFRVMGFRMIK